MQPARTLTAVYDLAVSPPTYDFVGFLLAAEEARMARGLEAIDFLIAPGPEHGFRRDHLPPRDPAVRRVMLDGIVVPMVALLPSARGVRMLPDADHESLDTLRRQAPERLFPAGWSPRSRLAHYGTHAI